MEKTSGIIGAARDVSADSADKNWVTKRSRLRSLENTFMETLVEVTDVKKVKDPKNKGHSIISVGFRKVNDDLYSNSRNETYFFTINASRIRPEDREYFFPGTKLVAQTIGEIGFNRSELRLYSTNGYGRGKAFYHDFCEPD